MVKKLAAQPPQNEFGNALLFFIAPRANEGLAQHSQFGLGGEQFSRQESQWRAGHFNRSLVSNDVARLGLWIRVKAPVRQAGVPNQLPDFRRSLQDGIGAKLSEVPIALN